MCERFVRERYSVRVMAIAVTLFFLNGGMVASQNIPEGIESLIRRSLEEEPEANWDYDYIISQLEDILASPVNINGKGVSKLLRLSILTDFQVISLQEYIKEYGEILSLSELSLVHGFSPEIVELIAPLIIFSDRIFLQKRVRSIRNDLVVRYKRDLGSFEEYAPVTEKELFKRKGFYHVGSPDYLYSRYRIRYSDRVSAGFTIEKDRGEAIFPGSNEIITLARDRGYLPQDYIPFIDFISMHLCYEGSSSGERGIIKRFIIGDYTARFGQGLVLWNTFSSQLSTSASSVMKRQAGVSPYRSSDESKFFRGVALTLGYNDLSLTLLVSKNRRDALTDEQSYYSLPESGFHNTISSLERRKTLSEGVAGANFSFERRIIRVGVNAAVYSYDKENKRSVRDDNRDQMYTGVWYNLSSDLYLVLSPVRIFAEVALSKNGKGAFIGGVLWDVSDKVEGSVLYRYYDKGYISNHSGAYSSLSSTSNQNALLVRADIKFSRLKKMEISAETIYYPGPRYRMDAGGKLFKVKTIYHSQTRSQRLTTEIKTSAMVANYTPTKISASLAFIFEICSGIRTKLRADGNVLLTERAQSKNSSYQLEVSSEISSVVSSEVSSGLSLYNEWQWDLFNNKLQITGRATLFRADNWDNRLFLYERDLPNSFSVPSFWGRGVSGYLFVKHKLKRGLTLSGKYSHTGFSGENKNKSNVRLQLNWLF